MERKENITVGSLKAKSKSIARFECERFMGKAMDRALRDRLKGSLQGWGGRYLDAPSFRLLVLSCGKLAEKREQPYLIGVGAESNGNQD